jgi:GMP synthase-like glutamine amidotransferase
MKAWIFQHVPFEGLGSIGGWLAGREAEVSWTRWFEAGAEAPENFAESGLLVVLGGPMSANDGLAWLGREREAIRRAMDAGTAVLGLCLGAQQIARVLGARVFPGPELEIGWWPVKAAPGADGPFAELFPKNFEAFHWHGETFEIPDGAEHLARSEGCDAQAFAYGNRVLALQFHLETTPQSAADLITHSDDHLKAGRFVQSAGMMRSDPDRFSRINQLMDRVLDQLVVP